MSNFLFIGGDMRSLYAAEELNASFDCFAYGFANRPAGTNIQILREPSPCANIVLGLPASLDGKNVNAPYSELEIPYDVIADLLEPGGTVFAGKISPELTAFCEHNLLKITDYFAREEFAVMNAVPTAEGALEIAMNERMSVIDGSRVLITGYGRVARVTAKYFTSLGAHVTVAARKASDRAWAEIEGCSSVSLESVSSVLATMEIIINTVPASVFTKEMIMLFADDALYIDLASKCGLSDVSYAASRGVKIIHAQSIPGKAAPKTAGKIIASTILNITKESGATKNE